MLVVVEEEEIDLGLHRVHHLFLQLAHVETGDLHPVQAVEMAVMAEPMVLPALQQARVLPIPVVVAVDQATAQLQVQQPSLEVA